MTDDSSGSFVSDVATPEHLQASPMAREDRATDPRSAWRPVYRGRWSDAGNDCFAVTGGRNLTEDVTAQAFSSSFNGTESSPRQRDTTRSRRNLNRKNKYEKSDHQPRAGQDAVVVELRSKLAATRAELERKEVVSRSLQRQLHQVPYQVYTTCEYVSSMYVLSSHVPGSRVWINRVRLPTCSWSA